MVDREHEMNTEDLMNLSLRLAGLSEVPEDSAIHISGDNLKKILLGIDAGAAELLLARNLGCDAVIAHHPPGGTAAINFHEVFKRHIKQMTDAGVPVAEAERAVKKKLEDLEADAHARNYSHAVDVARMLKMPYMNIHTPLDEIGRRVMAEQINRKTQNDSTVDDVVSALSELPEFENATTKIKARVGKPENPAGRVAVSHGAGTNGGYEVAKTYFRYGIGTVIYIHIGLGDLERLRADGMGNLIITGHIASDSVGINPFIKELRRNGIDVTTIGVISG